MPCEVLRSLSHSPRIPWGDGTMGGILAINGDHARQHHGWVMKGLAQ